MSEARYTIAKEFDVTGPRGEESTEMQDVFSDLTKDDLVEISNLIGTMLRLDDDFQEQPLSNGTSFFLGKETILLGGDWNG